VGTKPLKGVRFPRDPQGGEKALGGEPEAPMRPKGPTEPRPEMEAEVSAEAPKTGTAVGATVNPGAASGARPTSRGT